MDSKARLKEIQERLEKASPGPWTVLYDIRPDVVNEEVYRATNELEKDISVYQALKRKDQLKSQNNAEVYAPEGSGFYGEGQIVKDMSKKIGHVCELAKYWSDNHSNTGDAEFIAHAREDVEFLLKEVQWLTGTK